MADEKGAAKHAARQHANSAAGHIDENGFSRPKQRCSLPHQVVPGQLNEWHRPRGGNGTKRVTCEKIQIVLQRQRKGEQAQQAGMQIASGANPGYAHPQGEGGVEGAGTSEEQFVLKERFMFADGERSEREWRVKKVGESGYEGRAHDVVGFAKGQAKGRALNWSYVLRVPVSGKDRDITFDDWMILQPDGVLFNRATMSKWGVRVGEIVIFFKRA